MNSIACMCWVRFTGVFNRLMCVLHLDIQRHIQYALRLKNMPYSKLLFEVSNVCSWGSQPIISLFSHSQSLAHNVYTHHTCTKSNTNELQYVLSLLCSSVTLADKDHIRIGAPFWKVWYASKLNIFVLTRCLHIPKWSLFEQSYQWTNWAQVYDWCHTGYKSCGHALTLSFMDLACDHLQYHITLSGAVLP